MSLLRRRMMMAKKPSGGGGDTGGFYAEFYFDYCENLFVMLNCWRYADELGLACYNEVVRLIEEYGTQINKHFIELDNPINYGFEVYVEGSIVTKLTYEYGIYFLYTNGEYTITAIDTSGALNYEG